MALRSALVVSFLALPGSTPAQQLRGEGSYQNYGYRFTAWQRSPWTSIEYRSRCDGEAIRGSNTGPIRWTVEYRNRSKELVHFDYQISPPGPNKPASTSGRAEVKPGKTMSRLATLPTSRCDEGMVTSIGNVRFGADSGGTPYAKPGTDTGGTS
jgi:hypothetical protein